MHGSGRFDFFLKSLHFGIENRNLGTVGELGSGKGGNGLGRMLDIELGILIDEGGQKIPLFDFLPFKNCLLYTSDAADE